MLQDDRKKMFDYLQRQTFGPANGPKETLLIKDNPTARYLMGTLYPQQVDADEALENEDSFQEEGLGDDEGSGDSPVSMAYQYMPSSMGISFFVTSGKVSCRLSAANYVKRAIEEEEGNTSEAGSEGTAEEAENDLEGKAEGVDEDSEEEAEKKPPRKKTEWQRVPIYNPETPEIITIAAPRADVVTEQCSVLNRQAALHSVWRKREGGFLVTVTLINAKQSGTKVADEDCLFQVGLECAAVCGEIREYPSVDFLQWDIEEEDLSLQYRHRRTFAVGHGCSASWAEGENGSAEMVRADFLPYVEVPDLTADTLGLDELTKKALSLQFLADPTVESGELREALEVFVDGYSRWIEELPSKHTDIGPARESAKERILKNLSLAESRMREGVDLLIGDGDGIVRKSFCLSNYAMLMQMIHSGGDYGGTPRGRNEQAFKRPDYSSDIYGAYRWRPFQLAFFLLSLESVVNEKSKNRNTVDLIWFPTGGGKTEAYLALAAFEMFHRRFRHGAKGMGTAVIKRYTLRLLTSQQFQRAATLICACEMLLRERGSHGFSNVLSDFPGSFSLGLWVGGAVTPNKFTDANESGAKELYENLLAQDRPENPFQLTKCPWCGTQIVPERITEDEKTYGIEAKSDSFKFYCPTDSCPFHDKLPITVVDQDIYKTPPSFLVGTIDKFARIAWDDRANSLFGRHGSVLPPSLIIQDELHLISGPLGTIAGIYEAAIDTVMEVNGGNAKTIAATATIRRAADQCRKLYGREVAVFPPQGLSYDDSYFSRVSDGVGRLYVGVMAPAHRPVTSLVHVSAVLSQGPIESGVSEKAKDGYWSQIIFHNSRRELGKTMSLGRDDIPARVKVIAHDQNKMRSLDNVVELSANVPGKMIPVILERLDYGPKSKNVVDVLPCTNMLSVGVDVKRLGLMVVNGQPKTTAEYIQASSRVGRDTKVIPGLVVSLYSPTKPRDRSYYEKFVDYHQALYKAVEPTSVTPYAMPARGRALHAALVSVMRLAGGLPFNGDAQNFDPQSDRVKALLEKLKNRIACADPDMASESISHLDRIVLQWEEMIRKSKESGRPLLYDKGRAGRQYSSLLQYFGGDDPEAWQTLNSMRHVDQECLVYVRGEDR